jgi:L-aspartate oxidase
MKTFDVVIVGSGIGGLSLALKLSKCNPVLQIALLTKTNALESNTRYAQGGIAAVLDTLNDSFESHIKDTLASGGSYCKPDVVEMVVKNAPKEIYELINWGVQFDKAGQGELDAALEGGHENPRVVHYKDQTGFEVVATLLDQVSKNKNIRLITHLLATDILLNNQQNAKGIWVYNEITHQLESMNACYVVLATGGCGQLFENTTNPKPATGDGYAIAKRAGAQLQHMNFMQFHPTALYAQTDQQTSFLISEALRGYGAYIVDQSGKRFLFDDDVRGELATRDIVSNAIYQHLEKTKSPCVYLDVRHLDEDELEFHFPAITQKLVSLDYNLSEDLIPIIPSAHYQSGGVVVDVNGQTNINNLYALGEVACTGLHGKNRLASNSLLEALVFAEQIKNHIVHQQDKKINDDVNLYQCKSQQVVDFAWVKPKIKTVKKWMTTCFMSKNKTTINAGIAYMKLVKQLTQSILNNNTFSVELMQLHNMATTAEIMLQDVLIHQQNNQPDSVKQVQQ